MRTPTPQQVKTKQMKQKTDTAAICQKQVLTSREAAAYLGISISHLYKLTMRQEIPHYKPEGKMLYFDLGEVEAWARRNRIATVGELNEQALSHCRKGGAL